MAHSTRARRDQSSEGVVSGAYGGATAPAGSDDTPIADSTNSFGHPLCGFGEIPVVDLLSMSNF